MEQLSFDDYFDELGCLVIMPDKDGGDSAQMTALYRFGKWILGKNNKDNVGREWGKYNQELDYFSVPWFKKFNIPGLYRRHPGPGWWANWKTFSRDQSRATVIAMGALKHPLRLSLMLIRHLLMGGFYTNFRTNDNSAYQLPDFATPDIWGEYIRAFYMAGFKPLMILWPVLFITDLYALAALGINFGWVWTNPNNVDDDNLIMSVLQARFALPTPISWLIRKLYVKYRPIGGYVDAAQTIPLALNPPKGLTGPQSAMNYKHRISTGSPPFGSLYQPILDKYL